MNTQKIKKIVSGCGLTFLLLLILSIPSLVQAVSTENNDCSPQPCISNPLKSGSNLMDLLQLVLKDIVMPLASIAAVVYIIWAGFLYVTAQGKPAEIQKANQNLMWALIGVGVLLGATGISQVIQTTVNSVIK